MAKQHCGGPFTPLNPALGFTKLMAEFCEFQGFHEGSSYSREMIFCFSMLTRHDILDHRAAFRLQVGQLVVQDGECR